MAAYVWLSFMWWLVAWLKPLEEGKTFQSLGPLNLRGWLMYTVAVCIIALLVALLLFFLLPILQSAARRL